MSFAPDAEQEAPEESPLEGARRDVRSTLLVLVAIVLWVVISALAGS